MSDVLRDRDDDGRRASHVAESVLVLVLGHLADDWRALLILGDFWSSGVRLGASHSRRGFSAALVALAWKWKPFQTV